MICVSLFKTFYTVLVWSKTLWFQQKCIPQPLDISKMYNSTNCVTFGDVRIKDFRGCKDKEAD